MGVTRCLETDRIVRRIPALRLLRDAVISFILRNSCSSHSPGSYTAALLNGSPKAPARMWGMRLHTEEEKVQELRAHSVAHHRKAKIILARRSSVGDLTIETCGAARVSFFVVAPRPFPTLPSTLQGTVHSRRHLPRRIGFRLRGSVTLAPP